MLETLLIQHLENIVEAADEGNEANNNVASVVQRRPVIAGVEDEIDE